MRLWNRLLKEVGGEQKRTTRQQVLPARSWPEGLGISIWQLNNYNSQQLKKDEKGSLLQEKREKNNRGKKDSREYD